MDTTSEIQFNTDTLSNEAYFAVIKDSTPQKLIKEILNLNQAEAFRFLVQTPISAEIRNEIIQEFIYREYFSQNITWMPILELIQKLDSRFQNCGVFVPFPEVGEQIYRYRMEFVHQQLNGQVIEGMNIRDFYTLMQYAERKAFANISAKLSGNTNTVEVIVHTAYLEVFQEMHRTYQKYAPKKNVETLSQTDIEAETIVLNRLVEVTRPVPLESNRIKRPDVIPAQPSRVEAVQMEPIAQVIRTEAERTSVPEVNMIMPQIIQEEIPVIETTIESNEIMEETEVSFVQELLINLRRAERFVNAAARKLLRPTMIFAATMATTPILGPVAITTPIIGYAILYPRKTFDYSLNLLTILGTIGDRYFFREFEYKLHELFGWQYSDTSEIRDELDLAEELRLSLLSLQGKNLQVNLNAPRYKRINIAA